LYRIIAEFTNVIFENLNKVEGKFRQSGIELGGDTGRSMLKKLCVYIDSLVTGLCGVRFIGTLGPKWPVLRTAKPLPNGTWALGSSLLNHPSIYSSLQCIQPYMKISFHTCT
jgi:hypothetical protein